MIFRALILVLIQTIATVAFATDGCLCLKQFIGDEIEIAAGAHSQRLDQVVVDPITGNYLLVWYERRYQDHFNTIGVEVNVEVRGPDGVRLIEPITLARGEDSAHFGGLSAFAGGATFNSQTRQFVVATSQLSNKGKTQYQISTLTVEGELIKTKIIKEYSWMSIFLPLAISYNEKSNHYLIQFRIYRDHNTHYVLGILTPDFAPVGKRYSSLSSLYLVNHDIIKNHYLVVRASSGRLGFEVLTSGLERISLRYYPRSIGRDFVFDAQSGRYYEFSRSVDGTWIATPRLPSGSVLAGAPQISIPLVENELPPAHVNPEGGFFFDRRNEMIFVDENSKVRTATLNCDPEVVTYRSIATFNPYNSEFLITVDQTTPKTGNDIFARRLKSRFAHCNAGN